MKDIGIIGTNTGMLLAYLLCDDFNVTLFEKENRTGGHLNTLKIPQIGGKDGKNGSNKNFAVIEAGAEFINDSYVKTLKLIKHLGIKTNSFLMTMEYINGEERIPLSPDLLIDFDYKMFPLLLDLQRLILTYKKEKAGLEKNPITLDEYMDSQTYMNNKSKNYVRKVCSSSWGIHPSKAGISLVYYMLNYLASHPIFKEVIGGLSEIIRKLEKRIDKKVKICKSSEITDVSKIDGKYFVMSGSNILGSFDDVVICTNAKISNQISHTDINEFLSKVSYYDTLVSFQKNENEKLNKNIVVHIVDNGEYAETTILKSFNSDISKKWCLDGIVPENSIEARKYEHPYMDIDYFNAQEAIKRFNSKKTGIYYGSIIAGYDDSYESGVTASVDIAKIIYSKYELKKSPKFDIFSESSCC